ncbi:MAG TPA: hypothetical protein VK325_07135, partial [Pseudoxanthomonas sp.]|nr:hypothetical protein [Pseudoxanthomonas sp.]
MIAATLGAILDGVAGGAVLQHDQQVVAEAPRQQVGQRSMPVAALPGRRIQWRDPAQRLPEIQQSHQRRQGFLRFLHQVLGLVHFGDIDIGQFADGPQRFGGDADGPQVVLGEQAAASAQLAYDLAQPLAAQRIAAAQMVVQERQRRA